MSVVEIRRSNFTLKNSSRLIFSYKPDKKIVRWLSCPLSPLSVGLQCLFLQQLLPLLLCRTFMRKNLNSFSNLTISWCIKAIVDGDCLGGNLDRLNRSNWFPNRNVLLTAVWNSICARLGELKLWLINYTVYSPQGLVAKILQDKHLKVVFSLIWKHIHNCRLFPRCHSSWWLRKETLQTTVPCTVCWFCLWCINPGFIFKTEHFRINMNFDQKKNT